MKRTIRIVILALAAILLLLNIIPSDLSSPDLLNEVKPDNVVAKSSGLCLQELLELNPEDPVFLETSTLLVHECLIHYWNNADSDIQHQLNLWIPLTDNYILHCAAYFVPNLRAVELYDRRRIVERGFGLCSQSSILLDEVLRSNGYQSRMLNLYGHVVIEATGRDGENWILDPDYGVVIPHSLAHVEKNLPILESWYPDDSQKMIGIYKAPNLVGSNGSYHPNHRIVRAIVRATYVLIWVVPFLMILSYWLMRESKKTKT